MRIFDQNGRAWPLGGKLGAGGEGDVFRVCDTPPVCVKLYRQTASPDKDPKLRVLAKKRAALDAFAALPISLAFADPEQDRLLGFFQRIVTGPDIHHLYNPKSRFQSFPEATYQYLVRVARNTAIAFAKLHAHNVLVGDVSEQNIKVAADGTVSLIDCDSFQVSAADRVFPSSVGTPLWTPPELQGCDLTHYERWENHDLFGLGVLIFHLLFVGRHPYAGVPTNSEYVPPEHAIAKFHFAYDPVGNEGVLRPPPHANNLASLPDWLAGMFRRAFLKGSQQSGARPAAKTWADALGRFEEELQQCSANRKHFYFKGLGSCVWCELARIASIDFFPMGPVGAVAVSASAQLNPEAAAAVELLAETKPAALHPREPAPARGLTPSPVPSELLQPPSKGAPGFLGSFLGGAARWQRKRAVFLEAAEQSVKEKREQLAAAQGAQEEFVRSFQEDYAKRLAAARVTATPLLRFASEYEKLVNKYRACDREEKRRLFLKQFLLRDAVIAGVRPEIVGPLIACGVETAADVSMQNVSRSPGFNYPLLKSLNAWKEECDKRFVYMHDSKLSEAWAAEVRKDAEAMQESVMKKVTIQLAELRSFEAERRAALEELIAKSVQVRRQFDQARADLEHARTTFSAETLSIEGVSA